MHLFSWRRKQTNEQPQSRRAAAPKSTRRFRPQLEALEGRDVPSTLTVTSNLDSGAGSLRAEIAAAHKGATIVFAPSLDGQTITLTSGELVIAKDLTIQGPGASLLTISGDHASRVFEVGGGYTVTISGLTISNGYTSDTGGGAIYSHGNLTIRNSTLSGNNAGGYDGGAIFNAGNGSLLLSGCTLDGNTAFDGGAVYDQGSMAVSSCTLSNNSAADEGGAIYNDVWISSWQFPVISNSVFSNNAPDNLFPYPYYIDGGGNTFG
jgi:hypothetical protein